MKRFLAVSALSTLIAVIVAVAGPGRRAAAGG